MEEIPPFSGKQTAPISTHCIALHVSNNSFDQLPSKPFDIVIATNVLTYTAPGDSQPSDRHTAAVAAIMNRLTIKGHFLVDTRSILHLAGQNLKTQTVESSMGQIQGFFSSVLAHTGDKGFGLKMIRSIRQEIDYFVVTRHK